MAEPSAALARAILAADAAAALPLLRQAGFAEPEVASRALDRLSGAATDLTPLPADLLEAVLACHWPERALRHLERFVEVTGARAGLYSRLQGAPPVRDGLVQLLAHSAFLTDVLVRNPEHLFWLFEGTPYLQQPLELAALKDALRQDLGAADGPHLPDALRRLQRRELLRIGAGEVLGCKDVEQVGRELADLADVTLDLVLEQAAGELRQRFGRPCNPRGRPAQLAVVGLGKYGGRELNFSSDIDLLFVYDEDGHARNPGGQAGIDNHLFFDRLAERVIQVLTEVTAEGFLYRVDLRLRPEGEPGPLTRSLRSYWIYYETRGELWERQMLIKARQAAGSASLWRRLRDMLVPFVYPAHFAQSPHAEIGRIKQRIEADIRDRPGGTNNIKLQPGGIRDIEFAVQCLQLLRGHQDPRARSTGTLQAMAGLEESGALSAREAATLAEAYRFLRRLENLLQIDSGRATYAVPADDSAQARALGGLLGLGDRPLSGAVGAHLAAVREVYQGVLSARSVHPAGDLRPVGAAWLLEARAGSAAAARHLEARGYRDGAAAHHVLLQLGGDPMLTGSGRDHLEALLEELVPRLAAAPDPDAGLARFSRIVGAYGAAGGFYGMARSHPRFASMLVKICGTSGLLADLVQRDPGLLDQLVGLAAESGQQPLDGRTARDPAALRRYRDGALLRAGVDDLLGLTASEETFHRISDVADAVASAVFNRTLAQACQRWGRPRLGRRPGRSAGFVCFAGGKAGGRELDFSSDLDLFFVFEGDGSTGRGVDNQVFFSEVSQEVIRRLGDGLFPVDARLRPEGRSAPVTISLDGYHGYLQTRGATWERLALTRARQLAGSADLGRRLARVIEGFVWGRPLDCETVDEIAAMRRRIEPAPGGEVPPDLKRGPGGIVDVEFIAQILQLHRGRDDRSLRHTSTRAALERMVEAGALEPREGGELLQAYERLRQVQKALRLTSGSQSPVLPTAGAGLAVLARASGADGGDGLLEELDRLMLRTRALFERVMGRVRAQVAGLQSPGRARGQRAVHD